MKLKSISITVLILLLTKTSFCFAARTFPSLPDTYKESKFKEVQDGFDERAKLFLRGHHFTVWQPNRSDQDIIEEYKKLDKWRHHTWYSQETGEVIISRQDFMVAQDLLSKGYYKRPHLIAFEYNQTDGTYNSSTIVLNGHRFLALEAPSTDELTSNFFKLLQNHRVNQLVRLTVANEGGRLKSKPYWQNRIKTDPKTNQSILLAPLEGSRETFSVRYYPVNDWSDNQGYDPKKLLDLIQRTRKDYDPEKGLLACHCSGGVGRTGTFIAGFLLLQEIDRQLKAGVSPDNLDISIEKIVLQLSLQRFHMVARAQQYITLYRMVDLYISNLNK